MGRLADWRCPAALLRAVIAVYVRIYRIDMADFVVPSGGFVTFTEFFTRGLRAGGRPIDPDPMAILCPADGKVVESGTIDQGRLLQVKGRDFALADLLGGDDRWQGYEGGSFLTVYLSPRDYHRIHSPCAGRVHRYRYVPGELWTVSPSGVRGVPDLFARNERLITFMQTDFGEVAVVAVGATVVGRVKVVYHDVITNRRGASPQEGLLQPPHALPAGGELGRFELGSTVILLLRRGEAVIGDWNPGDRLKMGMAVGRRC